MPVAKPTDLAIWADGGGAEITVPTSSKQHAGWLAEKPPHQYFNWWMNIVYTWVLYLNDLANQAFTWAAQHTFTLQPVFPSPSWTAVTSIGTLWGAASSPQGPACWKDSAGLIRLNGQVGKASNSTAGETACTLPAGFRPNKEQNLVTYVSTGGGNLAIPITISTGGVLTIGVALTFSASTTNFVSLDGLTFSTNH